MERESFENDEIARVLNEHFVSIKVDREERPDVDRVYMTFVQGTTGSGGWPMSVWLTPDLKPFFGGTYFPPAARYGRPGFVDMLQELARVWRAERAKIDESAEAVTEQLRGSVHASVSAHVPSADVAGAHRHAIQERVRCDGTADSATRRSFRVRASCCSSSANTRGPATIRRCRWCSRRSRRWRLAGCAITLAAGFIAIRSTPAWRVPHFEKMLYDQAQLVLAYLEAAQASGDAFYVEVAEDTLRYVMREMTGPDGGFYSAEDADSVPPEQAGAAGAHKMEGAFYLWRADEIDTLLGADAPIVKARYGIQPNGNAPQDPQQEFTGKNLLYVARSYADIANEFSRTDEDVAEVLGRARLLMFRERLGRPRPHLDDKILTAWNGLMIAAFARVARVLSSFGGEGQGAAQPYLDAARRAATFIHDRMWNAKSRTLLRRFRDGDAGISAYAEDYAYLIHGVLELFLADPDPRWLEWAFVLQRRLDELFWDDANGGWFSTTGRDDSVLVRMKEDYDGAEPTASSVSVMNLLVLSHLVHDDAWTERVERTLRLFGERLEQIGRAVPMMAAAFSAYAAGLQQVVIVGDAANQTLDRVLGLGYRPFTLVLRLTSEQQAALASALPWIASMKGAPQTATAYVCRDFACQQPVTTAEALTAALNR